MAITPPAPQQMVDAVTWGKPVTDQLNTNTTDIAALKTATAVTAWTNATLQNGWTNIASGFPLAQYRKVGDNCQLRGMVANGTIGTAMFTLPVGFRPPTILQLTTVTGGGVLGVTTFNADGTVVASTGNTGSWMINLMFSVTA